MKREVIVINILLALSLFGCSTTSKNVCNPIDNEVNNEVHNQYDVESDGHVEEIVKELCSDEYLGRVVGTEENVKASEYIRDCFKNLEIDSFDTDDYFNKTNLRYGNSIEVNNVAAIIKGKESDNAVFITAHFDHVYGKDDNRLCGAIDNASGISVLLETAHKIKELTNDNPLDMDVVFVAYNSEETGLNGSSEFLRKYSDYYKNCYNINIDCVGYAEATELAMGNNDKNSEKLYGAMRQMFDEEGVGYNDTLYATKDGIQRGTSDQQIFRSYGFPALVLGDDKIIDVVHTPDDNLENVDFSDLEKLSDVLSKFVIKHSGETFQ